MLAAALTGWFVFQQVQDQLADAGTVGVPYLIDLRETQAVGQVLDAGLEPNVIREANADVEAGLRVRADADVRREGRSRRRRSRSRSRPGHRRPRCPDVIGQSRDEAVAALARADLEAKIVEVFSEKEPGTVTGQSPAAGEMVKVGTRVQINISRGVRPLTFPSVVGQPYESAASALQGAGFKVARRNVDSTEPAGTVVDQQPDGRRHRAGRIDDHAQRLEGPDRAAGPGRDEPGGGRRSRDARGVRLHRRTSCAEPTEDPTRRVRDQPGASGWREAPQGSDRDDRRRPVLAVSKRVRVAVLLGGRSSEHEISIASGRSVLAALDPARYDPVTVEIGRDGRWELGAGAESASGSVVETLPVPRPAGCRRRSRDVDVVLPILHGPFGEDGTVQGLLELAGVPYVGAGVAASAVCMDKDLAKAVLRARGIPVTRSVTIREGDPIDHPFEYPVFVKPARLGSSVGISKVRAAEELEPAVAVARRHDDKVLIEENVDGIEVECSVLGNRTPIASLPGEIVAHGFEGADWYDFSAKYDEGGMDLIVPPRIPADVDRARAGGVGRRVRRDRVRRDGAGRLLRDR